MQQRHSTIETIVVTNLRWFKIYLILQKIILAISFTAALLAFKSELISAASKHIIQGVSLSILLTLLLFNLFQRPSFFELKQIGEKIRIGLYCPDTRYLVIFSKRKIKYLNIDQSDEVLFNLNTYALSLRNKLLIKIKKENGALIQLKPIDFSWASEEDVKNMQQLFEAHNGKLLRL